MLVTQLCEGQRVSVLQLPVVTGPRPTRRHEAPRRLRWLTWSCFAIHPPVQAGGLAMRRTGGRLVVNKVTWQKVGRVTEPGRYMFRFGWLTVTAEDLAIWRAVPGGGVHAGQTADEPTPERSFIWARSSNSRGRASPRANVRRPSGIFVLTHRLDTNPVRTMLGNLASSLLRLQVGFRRRRIDRARGAGAVQGVASISLSPPIAGDHGRSIASWLDGFDRKSVAGSPQRQRALPPQSLGSNHGSRTAWRRLPRGHHQRRARAIVRQRLRPQRQRDQARRRPSAPRSRSSSHETPSASEASPAAAHRRRRRAIPSAGTHAPCRAHQMQPPIPAADADVAAVGGNQNIRLRHRQPPRPPRAPMRPRRTSAAAYATAPSG